MNLKSFLKKFDTPNSIVLLEGKRDVVAGDDEKMRALGKLLTEKSTHILFRSGNAKGADDNFSKGVTSVDPTRLQIIKPYTSHRKGKVETYNIVSLEDVNVVSDSEVVYYTKKDSKNAKLIDRYLEGHDDFYTKKVPYLLRDTLKVVGTGNADKATAGIFYDDLEKPRSGGTGHTIKVCEELNVPVFDQRVWMKWLEEA